MGVKRGDLKVKVVEARRLPNKSRVRGKQDVFVEVKVEGVAYRTHTVKDAGSAARFDEELTVNIVDLRRVLEITAFKPGHLGTDSVPIGDTTIDFGEVIAGSKEASDFDGWVDLKEKKPTSQEKGQLYLKFDYVPFKKQQCQQLAPQAEANFYAKPPPPTPPSRPQQPPLPPPKDGTSHLETGLYPPVQPPSTLPGTYPHDAGYGLPGNDLPLPQAPFAPGPDGTGPPASGFPVTLCHSAGWAQPTFPGGASYNSLPSSTSLHRPPTPLPPQPGPPPSQYSPLYPVIVPTSPNVKFSTQPGSANSYMPASLAGNAGTSSPAPLSGSVYLANSPPLYAHFPPPVGPYGPPPGPGGFVPPSGGFAPPFQHPPYPPFSPPLHSQYATSNQAPPLPPRRT